MQYYIRNPSPVWLVLSQTGSGIGMAALNTAPSFFLTKQYQI